MEYYSSHCGHCIKFASEYENIAEFIKKEGYPVIVGAIDVEKYRSVGEQENIHSFPTFIFFINQQAVPYEGDRKFDAFVDFIT